MPKTENCQRVRFGRRASDRWFNLLVETMQEGLVVYDNQGRLVFVNKSLCQMLGYTREEMLGHHWSEFLDDDNRELRRAELEKQAAGTYSPYELAWTAKNGRPVTTWISPQPIPGQTNENIGRLSVVIDITEKQRTKRELLKLSNAVEQSPAAVMITDIAGNIEYVNPAFSRLTGYTAKEVLGKNARLMRSGLTPHWLYQDLWRSITGGREWRGEICDRKKNGDLYWVSDRIGPIRDEQGKITHFLALIEDVTDQKRAMDALAASEKKYSTLVESALTGIYIVRQGRLLYANPKFAEIFGYSPEELTNLKIDSLISTIDSPLNGDSTKVRIVQGVTKEGAPIWVKTSLTWIDFQGFPASLGNIVDVTQEKHMEEILWRSERELRLLSTQLLEAQERERKRIANELHDGVGQQLSAIKFMLEQLGRPSHGESGPLSAQNTLHPVNKLIHEAIEEVRRISMDLRPSTLDDLGVLATIDWFVRNFREIYSDIRLETRIAIREEEIPTPLKAVIYRIVQEAFNNVVKHANADKIVLTLRKAEEAIRLEIRDNGVGFRLAEVLFRDVAQRGLGLSSMKERAESSGGTFSIETSPGAGACIRACWQTR